MIGSKMYVFFLFAQLLLPQFNAARLYNATWWAEEMFGSGDAGSSTSTLSSSGSAPAFRASFAMRVQASTRRSSSAPRKGMDTPAEREPGLHQFHLANASGATRIAEPDCLVHTGGTCMMSDCDTWRGPTTCDFGRCFCQPGYCASADGKCTPQRYTRLGTYSFRNVRWPSYMMNADSWGNDLEVSELPVHTPETQFILWQMADSNYLMSSEQYPDYFVTISRHEECDEDNRNCRDRYDPRLVSFNNGGDASVPQLTLRFATAPAGGIDRGLMLSSFLYPNRYLYVGWGSWTVSTNKYDPGQGGYWMPEPAFPFEPPPYNGVRCSYDCGSARKMLPALMVLIVSTLAAVLF